MEGSALTHAQESSLMISAHSSKSSGEPYWALRSDLVLAGRIRVQKIGIYHMEALIDEPERKQVCVSGWTPV